ncbi:MAG: ABC transporter ATP-binding protein [Verrucomicrobiales bacterium]|nr:ABC transporter ATP-binding protein [Verrucomicrobiales bacterium]
MKSLFRALSYFKPDHSRVTVVVGLMIASVGLNLLKPWPMALIVDSVLGQKPFPQWLPESWSHWSKPQLLGTLIVIFMSLHLLHAVLSAGQNYLTISVGLRGLQRVRDDVFGWLQRLSMRFHKGTEPGDLIFRAGTDACAFQSLLEQGVFTSLSALFSLLLMSGVMLALNWQLSLFALAAIPLLIFTVRAFSKELKARGVKAQQAESKVYSLIHQGIQALPLTQSYTREQEAEQRFQDQTSRAQRRKLSQHGLEVFYWLAISVLLTSDTALLTWFGARQVLENQLSLGELLVFLAYLGQMFDPLNQLSMVGATLSTASASIKRVFEVLDAPDEVKDAPNARPVRSDRVKRSRARAAREALEVKGNIEFDNVTFGYEPCRNVLNGLSFQLRAGQSTAIIGPSGSGKTTLLNLLPRFIDPATGSVLLEGVDLRQLRVRELRAQIALVLQEPIILPTTVAENISFGKADASMAEIEKAAKSANAHGFICDLKHQYRTTIGEGGDSLSVGERQRINLARAFLKNAPILIMDEPTSALDVESEGQVVESLQALMQGRTTLMVAHRLSTIQCVDNILVLEAGVVSEFGSPEDLIRRGNYFSRVAKGHVSLNGSVR